MMPTHAPSQPSREQAHNSDSARSPKPTSALKIEFQERVDDSSRVQRLERVQAMVDASPQVRGLADLQALADDSPQVRRLATLQALADDSPQVARTASFQDLATGAVQRAAAEGVGGSFGPLPHIAAIQAAFGHHDVSSIRAHVDSNARASADAMGVHAYASGEDVVFGRQPSLFVSAHEAAHVIQQRGGVQLLGGVGKLGDVHEHHADEVAGLVERGESAQSALDRYADPARPRTKPEEPSGGEWDAESNPLQACIQFWGEPDHYAMGQLAGKKAIDIITNATQSTGGPKHEDFKLRHNEKDPSKGKILRGKILNGGGVGKEIVTDEDTDDSDIFLIRDYKGNPISYGAANRFGGDLSPRPTGDTSTRAPSLKEWPGRVKNDKNDYGKLKKKKLQFGELTLLATNANHFYPLAGVEYLRQHSRAKQMMWMAVEMRRSNDLSDQEQAEKVARRAIIIEGFAGHFLADCFAAGHLSPHALGRIGDKNPPKVGALVNTWHDLFNALPDGVPTTLGRFHGDYSMDGQDLEYVSSVIANSLLEITMPWYAGQSYRGNVVLPEPDFSAIMSDPVIGPLWSQMCGDYSKSLENLVDLKRREDKTGLSKYTIYETTSGQQVSNEEVIGPILEKTFGGKIGKPKRIDDTGNDLAKIRGKVLSIVKALEQVLDYRAGWQPATGLSQGFDPVDKPKKYKYRIDLKSAQLAYISPATSPIIPLCNELKYWLWRWKNFASVKEPEEEERLREGLDFVLKLPDQYTKGKKLKEVRKNHIRNLQRAKSEFDHLRDKLGVPVHVPPDKPRYDQGPGANEKRAEKINEIHKRLKEKHGDNEKELKSARKREMEEHSGEFKILPSSSGRIVVADDEWLRNTRTEDEGAAQAIIAVASALDALASDPRPNTDKYRTKLYEMVKAKVQALRDSINRNNIINPFVYAQIDECTKGLLKKLAQWQELGTKKETARREVLIEMSKFLNDNGLFKFDKSQLSRSTGRKLGSLIKGPDEDE